MRTATMITGLLALAMLLPAGASALGSPVTGALQAHGQVDVAGEANADLADGALHLQAPDLTGDPWVLTGATIEVTQQYQEGYRTRAGPYELTRTYTALGSETRVFRDATITFGMDNANPELLAMVTKGATASAASDAGASVGTVRDTYVTKVEFSDQAISSDEENPAAGFWYHIDGPWLKLGGFDRAVVSGSFTLFVNNVTVGIDGSEEDWSTWTGYREDDPNQPASRFETRVTTLRVRDGELSSAREDGISIYGLAAHLDMDGTVTSEEVEGELRTDDTRFQFQQARLRMAGAGSLGLRAGPSGGQAGGQLAQATSAPIEIQPEGLYQVEQTPGVATTAIQPTPSEGGTFTLLAGLAAVAIAVLAIAVAGGMRAGILPRLGELKASIRERRVESWTRAGDRLTGARDYESALEWYERITSTYPTVTEAWYSQAVVLTELGRHEEAADAYAMANEQIGGDDPELLDLEALQAFKAGEEERARERWKALSVIDPLRLRERLQEPSLEPLRSEPWARDLMGPSEHEAVVSYV